MPASHLPADQHRTQPWKNGLGVSTTIADYPPASDFDGVLWQISSTGIPADCPFSSLPQLDRQFMVIEGKGVELASVDESGAVRRARVEPMKPYAFRGDWKTECRLLAGPVRVLNVMTRRERFIAEVSFADGLAPTGEAGGTLVAVDLKTLDAWRLEGEGTLALPPGVIAVVRIRNAFPG